jgi:hypothetical protein
MCDRGEMRQGKVSGWLNEKAREIFLPVKPTKTNLPSESIDVLGFKRDIFALSIFSKSEFESCKHRAMALQSDASAVCRPEMEVRKRPSHHGLGKETWRCLPGHILRPKPNIYSEGSSSVNVPSAVRNLSGMNCSAFGYRASSRDMALQTTWSMKAADERIDISITYQTFATTVAPVM